MKWFRFYHDAIDDPKVQRLPGDLFRDRFMAAVAGEVNEFSRFIAPGLEERLPFPQWRELRDVIFRRDGYTCQLCGTERGPLECDHIVALSRGGSNDPSNLQTLCRTCNRRKGAR